MSITVQRKVQKLLAGASQARLETPEMVQCMQGLSEFFAPGDNTLANRRRLRSLLDRRSVHVHQTLMHAVEPMHAELAQLETQISALVDLCSTSLAHVEQVQARSQQLLSETAALVDQAKLTEHRLQLVDDFMQRFRLSDAQIQILESDTINPAYFDTLTRLECLRNDCRRMLLESMHERIGLDIMDSLTKRLEGAYETLYRWVQQQCGGLHRLADLTPALVTALALLKRVPVYYQLCCTEVAQARRLVLISRWLKALTRGGPNGAPRPIEMHAHDPVRYTSDMLAWLHSAVANEQEFVSTLFELVEKEDRRISDVIAASGARDAIASSASSASSSSSPSTTTTSTRDADIRSTLGEVFEGVARVLKTRVEQALLTQPTPETAFRIWNVMAFYASTIGSTFPEQSMFRTTLDELTQAASTNVFDMLHKFGERLMRAAHTRIEDDLSLPVALVDALNQLALLLQLYDSSLVAPERRAVEFAPILSAALQPILDFVRVGSAAFSVSDRCVYSINALHQTIAVLKPYSFVHARVETLSLMLDEHAEALVADQAQQALSKCRLLPKLHALEEWERTHASASSVPSAPSVPITAVPEVDAASVQTAARNFYSGLFAVGAFVVPQCDRILDSQIRRSCRQNTARAVAHAYRRLYTILQTHGDALGGVQRLLQHTPAQIDQILEVADSSKVGSTGSGVSASLLA